jgi:hypothetical protein
MIERTNNVQHSCNLFISYTEHLCNFGSLYKDLCNTEIELDDNQENGPLRCSAMTRSLVTGSFVILEVSSLHRQFYGHCLNKPVILATVVLFRTDHLDIPWLESCELQVVFLWHQLLGPHMMKSSTYMYLVCSKPYVYITPGSPGNDRSHFSIHGRRNTRAVLANKMGLYVWWQNIQWTFFWTCRRVKNRGRSWTLGHMDLSGLGHISFNSEVVGRRKW